MLILVIALVLVGSIVALGVILPQDGYGHRPIPRSHIDSFPAHNRFL